MRKIRSVAALLLACLLMVSSVSCGASATNETAGADVIAADALTVLAAEDMPTVKALAADDAYVRGGKNADTNYSAERAAGTFELKTDPSQGNCRDILVKFDLSEMDLSKMQTVTLYLNISVWCRTSSGNPLYLHAYAADSNWSSDKVTWNTAPAPGEEVGKVRCDTKGYAAIDVTDYVLDRYDAGEDTVSLRVRSGELTVSQMKATSSQSAEGAPMLIAKTTPPDVAYETALVGDKAENQAIWDYANEVYDAWYARYLELLDMGDFNAEKIESDPDDYTITTTAQLTNRTTPLTVDQPTRLVTTLSGYTPKEVEVNRYGSIVSDVRYEATGHFYTKYVDGRWWIIDPEGYPCYIRGLNHLRYAYSKSEYQTAAMEKRYGTVEKWAIATSRWLTDELGFYTGISYETALHDVETGLGSYVQSYRGIGSYASKVGLNNSIGGSTTFLYDVMPVFSPDFEEYIREEHVVQTETYNAYGVEFLGFTTDNEIPVDDNMLTLYLNLDYTAPANHYEYACAWTWLTRFTGREDACVAELAVYSEELDIDLYDLFKGFVYDRYYSVVAPSFREQQPNSLYCGVRMLVGGDKWEWMTRFTGYWVDVMCINYYYVWEIEEDMLYDLSRWSGKPLMITEFYAKGNDAVGSDGKPFKNTDGAGWVVATQKERGYFYQNFTLRLLECPSCVGWQYFQYIDNDPLDTSIERGQSHSNKGIVNSDLDTDIYSDYTRQLALINNNVYTLIEYFDGVDYFK